MDLEAEFRLLDPPTQTVPKVAGHYGYALS
jgi:hypothetical protein